MRVNNSRNIRMNRRQMENRRKNQLKKLVLLIVRVVILLILMICIKNIYSRLEEIQTEIKQLKLRQFRMTQTGGEVQVPEESADVVHDMGYIEVIDTWEVGKPIERSAEEVLKQLSELAQDNSLIGEIYQNYSRYPKELLAALANNPEMADFVSGYPGGDGVTGGITESEKEQEFPLFLQWDPRWGYESYGESCIGLAGCGPTCLSMVLFYLTGDETLTPDMIAEYSMENGYYVQGSGTAWTLMQDMPKLYDIKVTEVSSSERNIKAVLDSGSIVICAMGRGYFTTSGHYIVIYGYDKDGFIVNDPNCVARSNERWAFSEIQYQIKNIWAYSKESK